MPDEKKYIGNIKLHASALTYLEKNCGSQYCTISGKGSAAPVTSDIRFGKMVPRGEWRILRAEACRGKL